MFAVPGWKLSVDLLATQGPSYLSAEKRDAAQNDPAPAVSQSKKRKRDQSADSLKGQGLEQLWKRHFEPSRGTDSKSFKSKDTKSPKTDPGEGAQTPKIDSSAVVAQRPTADPPNHPPKKTLKQKKKELKLKQSNQPSTASSKNNLTRPAYGSDDLPNSQIGIGHLPEPVGVATSPILTVRTMLPPQPPPPSPSAALTPLQAKMRNKLTSARFRHLNQTLYTSSSADALLLFSTSPELFAEYHAGFSQQVKDSWPQNPVDIYIRAIKERGILQDQNEKGANGGAKVALPRRKTGRCTIADLGCGDAPLARGCQSQVKALQLKFHNYDLHAPNSFVTKADIANLPLRDGEADVAVFCLSLMGTNWLSFVEEAWRILRGDGKGEVWVAEVKSRFGRTKPKVVENSVGNKKKTKKPKKDRMKPGDEDAPVNGEELFAEDERLADQEADDTDISAFVGAFHRRGFVLREESLDRANKMFISMVFTKAGIPVAGKHKGLRWNGRAYERISGNKQSGRMKFLDGKEDDGIPSDDEGKILKPTLYKTR